MAIFHAGRMSDRALVGVPVSRHRRQPRRMPVTLATTVAIGMAMWSATGVAQADESTEAIAEIWDRLPPEAQDALQESYGGQIVVAPESVAAQSAVSTAEWTPNVAESAPLDTHAARVAEREARRAGRDADSSAPPEMEWPAYDVGGDHQLAEIIAYQDRVLADALAMHEAAIAASAMETPAAAPEWVPQGTPTAWTEEVAAAPAPAPAPVAAPEPAPVVEAAHTHSSSCCNKEQLVQLAADAGFPDPNLAAAIAMSESGGNPGVPGDNGDSLGLWQINWPAHYDKGFSKDDLRTPEGNAAAAKAVYDEAGGFGPWTDYGNGNYERYL